MINFRFHLVSLIAVFLALALGIVVGSTVIDRAIVDGLKNQIDRVERNAEDQRRDNERLDRELKQLQTFAEEEVPFALQAKLTDVPVVVVATRGIHEGETHAVVETLRAAGALAPAILWVEESFAVDRQEDRAVLRELLGLPRADADHLRRVALEQLAARFAIGELVQPVPVDGAPAEPPPADVMTDLIDRGFLTVDRVGAPEFDLATFPGVGARAVVVGGPESAFSRDAVPVLVGELVDASLLTLAGEIADGDDDAPQGEIVNLVRSSDELKDRVSTVDNASEASGRVAVILALADLGRGQRGHYGVADGASRLLPVPSAG